MDSLDLAETLQYAVAVANVQLNNAAEVTIERKVNGNWQVIAGPQNIDALDLFTFNLQDQHTDNSQLRVGYAYRVTSTVPVIAYQFNPVNGQTSYLSDASMLYPTTALDHINYAVTWTSMVDNTNTNVMAYATAVGTIDDTEITITPSVNTAAGMGVPAGTAGVPFMITIDEGDVLSIAPAAVGQGLSGTTFESDEDHPFGFFVGQECALIPANTCCCDHMEEQLSGVRLWGQHFIGARVPPRTQNPPDTSLWQIYAAEDGTSIDLIADNAVTGLPNSPINLDKGEKVEFYAGGTQAEPGDFEIIADKPIAVLNYMTGAESPNAGGTGDPLAVQLTSVEQFLPRYVVLVPGTWNNDVAVVTREAGAVVSIDNVAIADNLFNPIGNGDYEVARVALADGVHVFDAGEDFFNVVIVGYDQWDSYGYLAGTGTAIVNPDPQ
jgi:hypothetical protein